MSNRRFDLLEIFIHLRFFFYFFCITLLKLHRWYERIYDMVVLLNTIFNIYMAWIYLYKRTNNNKWENAREKIFPNERNFLRKMRNTTEGEMFTVYIFIVHYQWTVNSYTIITTDTLMYFLPFISPIGAPRCIIKCIQIGMSSQRFD